MKHILPFLASFIFCLASATAKQSPNIIVVMTDDQGHGDLSITGNPLLKTPHIDSLAKDGAWLTHFYVNPVCTPTRAALMTGRYPQRTRAYDTYVSRAQMDPEEITIAERLKEQGYNTGIFGKWHLGDCYPMRPSDQGFDQSLIHMGGGLCQPADPIENNNRYTNPVLSHNNKQVQSTGYCTDVYFDHAIKFITKAHRTGKPFFVYLTPNAPHGPFHDVPKKNYKHFKGKTKDDKTARIFAMVENIDENMGRLLKHLDEKKLTQNTLVIFMTDNGPNGSRHNKPFRGIKGQVTEGGVRTAFFARWPEKIKAGHRNATNAAHIDLFPTFLAMAGGEKPGKIDGKSILPLLTGETPSSWPSDRTMFFQWHRGDPEQRRKFCVVSGNWKLSSETDKVSKPSDIRLFRLSTDPGEKTNLASKHPEKVAAMLKQHDSWFTDIAATRKDAFAPCRIVIGTPHETHTRFTKQDWQRTEGQGWGKQGQWLIEASKESSYSARIYLGAKGHQEALQVTVHAGDHSFNTTIPANTALHEFEGLKIPVGKYKLRVTTRDGKAVPSLYQLHLIKSH
ncbi:MAG: arylsulfatase [Akkermansiaceae bacterium]